MLNNCCYIGDCKKKPEPCKDFNVKENEKVRFCENSSRSSSDDDICVNTVFYRPPKKSPSVESILISKPSKSNLIKKCPRKKGYTKKQTSQLGLIVGIASGSFNIVTYKISDAFLPIQAFATNIIAFGNTYLVSEDKLEPQVIDKILKEGKQLALTSIRNNPNSVLSEKMIDLLFNFSNVSMEVYISNTLVFGRLKSNEKGVLSLYDGMRAFMQGRKFCLLQIKNSYFLIWKKFCCFFIFDCYGRSNDCTRNNNIGQAAVISLRTIRNVESLFLQFSEFEGNDCYTIREISMFSLLPSCENFQLKKNIKEWRYEQLNSKHAVLRGHFHIASNCFFDSHYNQAITIALVALIYLKIDPPCTWQGTIVDKILFIGNELYKLVKKEKNCSTICIQHLPVKVTVGEFIGKVKIFPNEQSGKWRHMTNHTHCEAVKAIKKTLTTYSEFIIQIGSYTMAIWKTHGIYYIFNPYQELKQGRNVATVHMISTFHYLCCILTQVMIDGTELVNFCIHPIRVTKIVKKSVIDAMALHSELSPCSSTTDASTLNESIKYGECDKTLFSVLADIVEPEVIDLDSPSVSRAEVLLSYKDLKKDIVGSDFNDSENGDDSDEDDDSENGNKGDGMEEFDLDDEDGTGGKKGKKRGKGGADGDSSDEYAEALARGRSKDLRGDKDGSGKGKKGTGEGGSDDEDGTGGGKKGKKRGKGGADGDSSDEDGEGGGKKGKGKDGKGGKDDKTGGGKGKKGAGGAGDLDADTFSRHNIKSAEMAVKSGGLCRQMDTYNPNKYPQYGCVEHNIAVIGSQSGTYGSLCKLLKSAFLCSDRALVMTPWGNFVVFMACDSYYLYDGCTCNLNRFRKTDLSTGTAGFLHFPTRHDLITEIIEAKNSKFQDGNNGTEPTVDDICKKYC